MKKTEFIAGIDALSANRPTKTKTFLKGVFLFKREYNLTYTLSDKIIYGYRDFIIKSYKGFDPEPVKEPTKTTSGLYQSAPVQETYGTLFEVSDNKIPYDSDFGKFLKGIIYTETFSDMLIRLQNSRHMKPSLLYHKAGIDAKHYSKIISDRNYKPKKETVFALAIALELGLSDTTAFLESAGYAFNPSSMFDMTVKYFISNEVYDRVTIDMLMESMNIPLLPQNW